MCMCVCHMYADAFGGQKRMLDPVGLGWENELGPLVGQKVILSAELSL